MAADCGTLTVTEPVGDGARDRQQRRLLLAGAGAVGLGIAGAALATRDGGR